MPAYDYTTGLIPFTDDPGGLAMMALVLGLATVGTGVYRHIRITDPKTLAVGLIVGMIVLLLGVLPLLGTEGDVDFWPAYMFVSLSISCALLYPTDLLLHASRRPDRAPTDT